MTFFSILFALIAEQYRPVTASHWIRRMSATWLDWVAKEFGGKSADGATPVGARLACLVGFGLPTAFVFIIYIVAFVVHPLLAFVWNIIIVYLFFGFRQFSHSFTEVHEAIQNHDVPAARIALQNWLGDDIDVPIAMFLEFSSGS
jgi:adenosylcobinamide-phosphate synthase